MVECREEIIRELVKLAEVDEDNIRFRGVNVGDAKFAISYGIRLGERITPLEDGRVRVTYFRIEPVELDKWERDPKFREKYEPIYEPLFEYPPFLAVAKVVWMARKDLKRTYVMSREEFVECNYLQKVEEVLLKNSSKNKGSSSGGGIVTVVYEGKGETRIAVIPIKGDKSEEDTNILRPDE
ncbi:hypothetical protein [Pyrococcus kukulkanii]|uniref:Uncharacterized protein n=1 Tax=Pyrococcus kukulkanii TaxID=1609559 RepID=A0ABV4T689_9EURY